MPVRRSSASLHEEHIKMMMLESCDEEGSVSSTQAVDKTKPAIEPVGCKPRKQVTFDETRNSFHANFEFCKEDTRWLWFDRDELHAFKVSKLNHAKEIIRRERRTRRVSEDPSLCYLNVMERVYAQCCEDDENDLEGIPQTLSDELGPLLASLGTNLSHRLLGLEGVTVRGICLDKRARRAALVHAVLQLQTQQRLFLATHEEGESRIARTAQALSRPSRLFAARLATARQQEEQQLSDGSY